MTQPVREEIVAARQSIGNPDAAMPPNLNLTPRRGPSVWARIESRPNRTAARAMVAVGAAAMAGTFLRRRSTYGKGMIAAGVTLGAIAYLRSRSCLTLRDVTQSWMGGRTHAEEAIDKASADSFPSSDPPSSMQTA